MTKGGAALKYSTFGFEGELASGFSVAPSVRIDPGEESSTSNVPIGKPLSRSCSENLSKPCIADCALAGGGPIKHGTTTKIAAISLLHLLMICLR